MSNQEEETPKIILFHYSYSPYAHKVSWYLKLRRIPYQECIQPPTMPRPDLSSLGVSYRRIPLLSIGRHIYADTTLILRELERRFPGAGALDKDPVASRKWGEWSAGVFPFAAGCIPSSLPLMRDGRFVKDREEYSGRSYKKEDVDAARPKALAGVRRAFAHIETEVLADDRHWITGADLTLADIEAIWVLEWVANLPGALSGSDITAATFPRTFAYITRFLALLPKAKDVSVAVGRVKGAEAGEMIFSSSGGGGGVGAGAGAGEEVEVVPVDTGKEHPQRGRLRGLSEEVVVLEVEPPAGGPFEGRGTLLVHFPREGYEVRDVAAKAAARL